MATRSTYHLKLIQEDGSESGTRHFYRHWDGYVAVGGTELSQLLRRCTGYDFSAAMSLMTTKLRGGDGADANSPQYEPMDTADEIGGAEYRYHLTFNEQTGDLKFVVDEYDWQKEQWLRTESMTRDQFRLWCATELRELRDFQKKMRKERASA
jgi:hypothetical protein